jgi:glyoxylase-like metal-dependent hydrolase (beta-lactamase superfamily II)
MIKKLIFPVFMLFVCHAALCQKTDEYQVYALRYSGPGTSAAKEIAVGANPADSIRACNMFWFLKGDNGRNIIVDAGYIDSSKTAGKDYERPDLVLKRLNISPKDITDIIITHPHNDHIGGIILFPSGKVWMQKKDYEYFVGEAWQESGFSKGFQKNDVRNLIEFNLQGRLKFVEGDNLEIIPGIKVFTGSKHTFENQYLLVNFNSAKNKILLASDAIWFYYNLKNLLPIPTFTFDPKAYVDAMKRMKTLVSNQDLIIPGHDDHVFSKFPKVADGIVKIVE